MLYPDCMAKKTTAKKTASSDSAAGSYSTRLTGKDKLLLEQAAEIADMTPAKFLRVAALKHAADILHAQAPNDKAIRLLANEVAKTLLAGEVTAIAECVEEEMPPATRTFTSSDGTFSIAQITGFDFDREHYSKPESFRVGTLSPADRRDLRAVIRAAPRAFAEALLNELAQPLEQRPRFKPVDIEFDEDDD